MSDKKMPRHKFWGAGEPDCPAELKAPNGELHTMRCKVCGDGWRKSVDVCFAAHPSADALDAARNAAIADEYRQWIDFYHAGKGDYADFLRVAMSGKEQGND